ncbi:HNH endonuclease [compost metagenome]
MLNRETLKENLHYDLDTGVFTWVKTRGSKAPAGSVAGTVHYSGYRQIHIYGKTYQAHRLAWLAFYGEFPSDQIDHINGIRDENRMENLRAVSNKENGKNQAAPRNNTSGMVGVYWDIATGKWRSNIKIDGRKITIGRYSNFFDAVAARKSAEISYGFHENHGREAPAIYKSW